jgi:cAMP-dependent protein kinase regulator
MDGNFMFDSLNPNDKKSIIDAIVPTFKKNGDVIIQQGDDGDNFYIVEKGVLICKKFLKPND